MAIETLEFGYTVIILIYYAGLYRKKSRNRFLSNDFVLLYWFILIETLEFDSTVMIFYYYAGLWR